jgi:hypothetical protein
MDTKFVAVYVTVLAIFEFFRLKFVSVTEVFSLNQAPTLVHELVAL